MGFSRRASRAARCRIWKRTSAGREAIGGVVVVVVVVVDMLGRGWKGFGRIRRKVVFRGSQPDYLYLSI